jgi:hypothetical protein
MAPKPKKSKQYERHGPWIQKERFLQKAFGKNPAIE